MLTAKISTILISEKQLLGHDNYTFFQYMQDSCEVHSCEGDIYDYPVVKWKSDHLLSGKDVFHKCNTLLLTEMYSKIIYLFITLFDFITLKKLFCHCPIVHLFICPLGNCLCPISFTIDINYCQIINVNHTLRGWKMSLKHVVFTCHVSTRIHQCHGQMAKCLPAKDGATLVCQWWTNHHGAGRSCDHYRFTHSSKSRA